MTAQTTGMDCSPDGVLHRNTACGPFEVARHAGHRLRVELTSRLAEFSGASEVLGALHVQVVVFLVRIVPDVWKEVRPQEWPRKILKLIAAATSVLLPIKPVSFFAKPVWVTCLLDFLQWKFRNLQIQYATDLVAACSSQSNNKGFEKREGEKQKEQCETFVYRPEELCCVAGSSRWAGFGRCRCSRKGSEVLCFRCARSQAFLHIQPGK